jgi:DNA-binding NarL/FixJ family response regulator
MDPRQQLVFIVEDNEMYSMMLDYTLSNESLWRVMSFKTGEECLENLHLNPVMIFLDQGLPGISGRETLEKIRQTNPAVPVAILTSNEDINAARDFLNKGLSYYLIKGEETVPQVEEIVEEIIQRKEQKEVVKSNKVLNRMIFGMLFVIAISIVVVYLVII